MNLQTASNDAIVANYEDEDVGPELATKGLPPAKDDDAKLVTGGGMVEWMRSRSSGPVHNRQVSPVASEGLRREEAVFSVMEKLVRAATNSSRQDNFKNAATHLRRAHQIASKHASEGLLAGEFS
eukprot:s1151_g4.t1